MSAIDSNLNAERVADPAFFRRFPLRFARRFLARDPRPTGAQVDAHQRFTRLGDPVADALVAWMKAEGNGGGRRLFELALENGIASVPDAPQELLDFFESIDRVPVWLDPAQIDIAQRATSRIPPWSLAPGIAIGLTMSYLAINANQVLIRSGDLHQHAGRRAVETLAWWIECTSPDGLSRTAPGFKSTARVRLTHAYIRAGMKQHPEWDSGAWGDPVNQSQMTMTLLPFVILNALVLPIQGSYFNARERKAVFHLYRYVGYLMGVDSELLPADFNDLTRLAWMAALTEVDLGHEGVQLADALREAMPIVAGLPQVGPLTESLNELFMSYCSSMTRLILGTKYADGLGLPRVHPVVLATGPIIGLTAGLEVVRILTPGGNRIATAIGLKLRRDGIQRATKRVDADRTHRREGVGADHHAA